MKHKRKARVYYRIQDYLVSGLDGELTFGSHVRLAVYKYHVLSHTRKGVWLDNCGSKRFVLNGARKQFACPTFAQAKIAFAARKQRQINILSRRLQNAKHALNDLKFLKRGGL